MRLNREEPGAQPPAPPPPSYRLFAQQLDTEHAAYLRARLREELQRTGRDSMTAVAEAPAVEEDASQPVAPQPEPEPEAPVHRRGRVQVEMEVKEKLEAYAARRILARQMCVGDPNVANGNLCNEGTQEFMAKGHLHPPGKDVINLNYYRERNDTREAGERLIRKDVWKPFGEPDCDLGDFTVQGLTRRLRLAAEANEKWATDFRALIVSNVGSYITRERRDDAFEKLGLEPWAPRRRITGTLRVSLEQPTDSSLSRTQQAHAVRDRFVRMLIAEFGTELGSERQLQNSFIVSAQEV